MDSFKGRILSGLKIDKKNIIHLIFLSGIPVGLIVLVHYWNGAPYSFITRDVAYVGGVKYYAGFLSQIGLFIWSGTIALLLFSKSVLYTSGKNKSLFDFLTASALITMMLLADDAFQFHEQVLANYGITEKLIYAFYFLTVLGYLLYYFQLILKTNFIYLLLAFGCFAVSILVDQIEPDFFDYLLLEDASKYIGICCWMVYFWIYARKELTAE